MKTFCIFAMRVVACAFVHWITYYVSLAQASLFLTHQSHITLTQKAKVSCNSITWLGDARIELADSASWIIHGTIVGADSNSRFFILGQNASLKRSIQDTMRYVFPVGYSLGTLAYRGFTLNVKSLGDTGPAFVTLQLAPYISGNINYEKFFPSNDPSCVAGTWVSFNCLSSEGWHCDGPSDYEYTVSACAPNYCSGTMNRIIKTSTGSSNWQDSIESVVGNLGESFCQYSNWSGGKYRDFSDFALASNNMLLPVTFVDVQANPLNQKCIRVSWRTETESNNDKFLIARGTDGSSFKIVGEEIPGSGSTTTPHGYYFDDCDVEPNVTYYYMVQQKDYDGAIDWSPIVSAKIEKEEVLEMRVWNLLGQEVPEDTPGVQIVQVRTASGVTTSKFFKPLP